MPIDGRIKELRKERAWSEAELGEKVGTDSQRISRYENGRLTPSLDSAARLAEALDVSVDYLVIEGASRRSLTDADSTLAARLAELGALDDTDRDAVLASSYAGTDGEAEPRRQDPPQDTRRRDPMKVSTRPASGGSRRSPR